MTTLPRVVPPLAATGLASSLGLSDGAVGGPDGDAEAGDDDSDNGSAKLELAVGHLCANRDTTSDAEHDTPSVGPVCVKQAAREPQQSGAAVCKRGVRTD